MNLRWFKYFYFFPGFENTQHVDSEYIIENGNENHIYIVD